jgi:RNA polymerase sigma-70 factor (ECF subfamily)
VIPKTESNSVNTELIDWDAETWRAFLEEQIPRLYGFFFKRWPNPALAEEFAQRTVFNAVRGRHSFNPDRGSAQEWVFGIARNVIRLELRKRNTGPKIQGNLGQCLNIIDDQPLPDEVIEQAETLFHVRKALNRLAPNEREVLVAKYMNGQSARQISRAMQITEKAVHSLLYRARLSLRKALEQLL